MLVELVQTQTADGLRLDGAFRIPISGTPSHKTCDSAILLSGVGSNFYGSSLMRHLTEVLVDTGVATLCVNTRGHDGVSTASTPGGGRLQGAAYEIVDDCRHDVNAWADFLAERNFSHIALIGHSLGAIKSLYSQAHQQHDQVDRIVAISPPRLSHDTFRHGPQAADFIESMSTAQQMVDRGESKMLFQAKFPFSIVISAATYLDKYGPPSRYDVLKFASRVACPVSFVYGGDELENGGIAFAGLPKAIAGLSWKSPPPIQIIPKANHFYTGRFDELSTILKSSLST
jgi:pimeloyl-ACP methyl ester carboxylesterase